MPHEQRTPTSNCGACRVRLRPGDRVRVGFVLNRQIRRQASFHEVTELLKKGDFELIHTSCINPSLGEPTLDQHVGMDTCGKCRKKLEPGQRVSVAFIVEAVEPNPATPFSGLQARLSGTKGEMVHSNCDDPNLLGTVIGVG